MHLVQLLRLLLEVGEVQHGPLQGVPLVREKELGAALLPRPIPGGRCRQSGRCLRLLHQLRAADPGGVHGIDPPELRAAQEPELVVLGGVLDFLGDQALFHLSSEAVPEGQGDRAALVHGPEDHVKVPQIRLILIGVAVAAAVVIHQVVIGEQGLCISEQGLQLFQGVSVLLPVQKHPDPRVPQNRLQPALLEERDRPRRQIP